MSLLKVKNKVSTCYVMQVVLSWFILCIKNAKQWKLFESTGSAHYEHLLSAKNQYSYDQIISEFETFIVGFT